MSLDNTSCPSCGATLPGDAVFCTRCGSRVPAPHATARAAPDGESGAGASAGDTVLERPWAAGPQAPGPPGAAPGQAAAPLAPRAAAPPSGAPSAAAPATGAQPSALWPPAPPPAGRAQDTGQAAAHDWIVPPPPASTGSGGGAARPRFPRWALIAVVLAAIAVAAALAVILIAGGGDGAGDPGDSPAGANAVTSGSVSPSPATTPSLSPTTTASPQASPAASPPAQAEQLTRFLEEVRPILKKWTALDKKLSRALWEEAHQTRDSTWLPAGRKIERLTDGFNSITAALWHVDTPAFMQPAIRDLLKCARLEHRAYDKAAAMLVSGDWKNKTWRTMSGAANKAWRAYLAKRDREKERLGLADG